jgi:hypothetical protein
MGKGAERSTQRKIKRLVDQLNRCRGNGRMAYNLNHQIETLKNSK